MSVLRKVEFNKLQRIDHETCSHGLLTSQIRQDHLQVGLRWWDRLSCARLVSQLARIVDKSHEMQKGVVCPGGVLTSPANLEVVL